MHIKIAIICKTSPVQNSIGNNIKVQVIHINLLHYNTTVLFYTYTITPLNCYKINKYNFQQTSLIWTTVI